MPRKKATSKRANNEGSVYKNKRGLWVAQATIGYDENGKDTQSGFGQNARGCNRKPCPLSSQKRRAQATDPTGYAAPKAYAILVDEIQKAHDCRAHI